MPISPALRTFQGDALQRYAAPGLSAARLPHLTAAAHASPGAQLKNGGDAEWVFVTVHRSGRGLRRCRQGAATAAHAVPNERPLPFWCKLL